MISTRSFLPVIVLSAAIVGCGGGSPPKDVPKQTEEQKAEADKQHAEMKAKTDGGAAPGAAHK